MNYIAKIGLFIALMLGSIASALATTDYVTMQVGETKTLYLPSSVTSKDLRSVNFYSNGINYVQVTSHTNYSVTVKAIKAFSSPIIVRCDYYYYVRNGSYTYQTSGYHDFNITVEGDNKVQPTKITFPSSVASVKVGESRQLTPTVYPADAEYTLTWSINDSSVASISQSGLLVGKKEGEADLKVRADNGVYAMLRIVVTDVSPTSVTVTPSSLDLTEGEMRYLYASVYPSAASQKVTWSSGDENIAKVTSSGAVTAVGQGSCYITARTSNGRTDRCFVTVSPKTVNPTSISVTPQSAEIEAGESVQLAHTIMPGNATTTVKWSSSDTSVATVSNGKVTGVSPGTCIVTATTSNGLSATSAITVKAKEVLPQTLVLSPESVTLAPGEEVSLTAQIFPEDATFIPEWASSDTGIAAVEGGKVTAIREGSCEVTVTSQNGISASCRVIVEKPVVMPQSVTLSDTMMELTVGEFCLLETEVLPVDAVVELNWESSDTGVATVADGVVTAIAPGECIITVTTQNGLSSSCKVTVNPLEDPIADWSGSYRMKAAVESYGISGYSYPTDFTMDITKGADGMYYISSFIGLDIMEAYPYTGFKLNVISDTEAVIDLDYSNDAGGWTMGHEYTAGLHLLSSKDGYSHADLGTITLTKSGKDNMAVSDFYVYFFGQTSDYEYSLDARYSACSTHSGMQGIEGIGMDGISADMIEIYTMDGRCIYSGNEENAPELGHGIYVIRKGGTAVKIAK